MASSGNRTEVFISVVIETEGPIPGTYSMRGLGAVAVDCNGKQLSTFEVCLSALSESKVHETSTRYWSDERNVELYKHIQANSVTATKGIGSFVKWTRQLKRGRVLASYNSAFTWMWIHWYCTNYADRNPFTMMPLDLRSQASVYLGQDFLSFSKADMPISWRLDSGKSLTLISKAEKQAHILQQLIKARADLHDHFDIPAWIRSNYGPSVRTAIGQAGKAAGVGST